ncbi:Pre-mRNA-splicing factor sap61 [Coemansia interrupta]|uniref:Pre-mRNA-splicing factor sap61 n=1 Tax=Coemansia interrupta TaxID=1126814 RepID=A0A9W8LGF3_9FUNG|nr:Pre-mRNA-splicing factor sap61 [Coemansia interrupta]
METSIIEQQRQALEDIERSEQAIVAMMQQDLSKHRYRLLREHKISTLLTQIQTRSRQVLSLNEDSSGRRHEEMESMASHQLEQFTKRLDQIHAHYRGLPGGTVHPPEMEYARYAVNPEHVEREQRKKARAGGVLEEDTEGLVVDGGDTRDERSFVDEGDVERLDTMFSGDERLGRHVDLHAQHDLYLNLPQTPRTTYLEYLGQFSSFEEYPRHLKSHPTYTEYLQSLDDYFSGYFSRAKPLFDLPKTLDEAQKTFDHQWTEKKVPGWQAGEELTCTTCNRQFEKPTTYAAHMKSRKHQKAMERSKEPIESGDTEEKGDASRRVAWLETKVRTYAQILSDSLRDTRANIERRQGLTEAERRREQDEDDDGSGYSSADGSSDEQTYNPLNLPLGWDGKPIPFWLYKLHGLGIKFTCEICGNAVYRGRKAYEKHFMETRHATNMRRLGIPNTRQFHGIAAIDEAKELWERVQRDGKKEVANKDTFEEYEDSEGNVFNKKTYMDLKRQGLI